MAVLATDNFDRADNDNLGAFWDVMTSELNFTIVGNQVVPSNNGGDCGETYNAVTWPNDQYAQAIITATNPSGVFNGGIGIGVLVRGATAARTYYRTVATGTTVNGTEIAKIVAGSYTQLAAQAASWIAADVIYLSVVGTTLQVKRNSVNLFSTTDASIASGRAGISYSSNAAVAILDNWEGGDFASTFTPMVKNVITYQAVNRAATY